MEIPNKFEIHYFLKNDSHSMDAVVRNKCEAEFLAIAYELIAELGFDIAIDSEVPRKGGYIDIWTFTGDHSNQIQAICAIITVIMTGIGLKYVINPKTDTKDSELKELSIIKLRKELMEGLPQQESIELVAQTTSQNYKTIKRRSNFYKHLVQYEDITQIGTSTLGKNYQSLTSESIVPRGDFNKFILLNNQLKAVSDPNARIEIIAPVLIKNNSKWKGLYNGEIINFSIADKAFKEAVISQYISFKNGSAIICVLEINMELNELGDVVPSGWKVLTVLDVVEGNLINETPSGKKYRHSKKFQESQTELFIEQ